MKIVNKTGYLKGAKTAKNPVNIIPSNLITTQGMAFPIKANGKTLYPNTGQYKFPTSPVVETPLKKKFQEGTEGLDAMEYAKFPNRIKDKKRRDTQIADIYNATLDHHRGDTINAKRKFKSFFTHYGSERFDNVKPLEGYYGFDRKDYDDKTLDSLNKNWHKQMKISKKQQGTKSAKPEFASPAYFKNLFSFKTAKNPTVDKKRNTQLMKQYEAATKRGLSSEGLGDLALGLSGEALAGAGVKAGSKLYKAASPYVKNALKGLNVNKKGLTQTNKIKKPLTYKDPDTGEIVYEIDPEDYNNFSTPEEFKLAKSHFDEYVNNYKSNIAQNEENLLNKAKRILIGKQPLLKKESFHTNSEVKKMVRNHKDFKKLEKEINDVNPNIDTEEKLNKLFLTRPDLEKRWYGLAEEGKDFNKKMLWPEQQKLLDTERGYISGTSRPGFMPAGSLSKEKIHPSPQELRKVKFPIQFGFGSMNKNGNKGVKSNLVKYKDGSKSVSLAFSRGEKDPKGGLTQKGVDKYNRATGGNLKMAVTTPPSKLKPGSKAANRRKSFCARMSGVKGPMRKPNGKPTRKALALRKWNC